MSGIQHIPNTLPYVLYLQFVRVKIRYQNRPLNRSVLVNKTKHSLTTSNNLLICSTLGEKSVTTTNSSSCLVPRRWSLIHGYSACKTEQHHVGTFCTSCTISNYINNLVLQVLKGNVNFFQSDCFRLERLNKMKRIDNSFCRAFIVLSY